MTISYLSGSSGSSTSITTSSANMSPFILSSGLNDKVIHFQKFGENQQIPSGNVEDIWDNGGDYVYPTTATVASISSSSAQDSATGTGISVVNIQGLDQDWNLIEEDVSLQGTTTVTTTNTYIRVFRMRAVEAGSSGSINTVAVGDIEAIVDGQTVAVISEDNTSTKMSMISCPDGYTGFITGLIFAGGPNDDFIVETQIRQFGENIFFATSDFELSNSSIVFPQFDPSVGPIPSKADIKFRATAVSNNTQTRASFNITFIENTFLLSLADKF